MELGIFQWNTGYFNGTGEIYAHLQGRIKNIFNDSHVINFSTLQNLQKKYPFYYRQSINFPRTNNELIFQGQTIN
jgi:hypothetical protein